MRISNPTLREGAGLVDRTHRGRLRITGNDRRAYLQGLLTNDIAALGPGDGCYAAYLTPQGRMISDMRVFETGDEILMDLEGSRAAIVADRLAQFIFSEDVDVKDVTAATAEIGLYGPLAAPVLRSVLASGTSSEPDPRTLELSNPRTLEPSNPRTLEPSNSRTLEPSNSRTLEPSSVRRVPYRDSTLTIVRSDDLGVAGFDVILDAAMAAAFASALRNAGAADVDEAAAEAARIEAGRPRFGVDMDEDTIPLEAGIEDRAISLTKGCYVGQEIIIRVLHRGHGRVARRLVHLHFAADAAVPRPGQTILAGEREIGRITSAAMSAAYGRPIALGYVHRDFAAPGTLVSAGGHSANVAALPVVIA